MEQFQNDLSHILESDFSVNCSFDGQEFRAIFDRTYLEVDPAQGVTVADRQPRIVYYTDSLERQPTVNSIITVEEENFTVSREPQNDNTGSTVIFLKK